MNRWPLVRELFAETVALAAEERARILRERSGGDRELERRVEALVLADAAPADALERGALELLHRLRAEPPAEELCGRTFGPYRIEEHLASGGMAHVYRATRQSAGTQRRVALKLLRPGLDTDAFLSRFRRERETLAALEHEHIVAFLDAGTLGDGRPYLVMEYVQGEPLTDWASRVPLRARLELFLKVLATVQYAHQKLVVHRDLKPSNVLVTTQGTPKLLDFGVASVLTPEGEETGHADPLTPAYASPEQLRGDPITTATDIFTLGVMLHELVLGVLPGAALEIPGDLGCIVRKALASDPKQRFPSADRFADDLRRHLACEPISARRATWAYVAALFVRRHRAPLALAAALVLALSVGWVGSDWKRRSAEHEAQVGWGAHAQAKVAARVFEAWIAATAAADPRLAEHASEYLSRALSNELEQLPEAQTLVRLALAELYLERGELQLAAEQAERAWHLAQTTRGVGPRERQRATELRERLREQLRVHE